MTDSKTPDWVKEEAENVHYNLVLTRQANIDTISQALLSAYERGRAEREWQPIETAPKDGRKFIAGRFAPEGDKSQPNNLVAVDRWHKMPEDGYTGLGQFNNRYWPATHWMPLPAPPAIRQLLEVKG